MKPYNAIEFYGDDNLTIDQQDGPISYRTPHLQLDPDTPVAGAASFVRHRHPPIGHVDTPLADLAPVSMGMPDGANDKAPYAYDMMHHQTLYCNGRISATTCMVGGVIMIFIACSIAAGFIIHMSNETEKTAIRVNVIADQFEATGAMLALKLLVADFQQNHVPLIRDVLQTVNGTSFLAQTLTSSVMAIDLPALMKNTSLAISRMDQMLNTAFQDGGFKVSLGV